MEDRDIKNVWRRLTKTKTEKKSVSCCNIKIRFYLILCMIQKMSKTNLSFQNIKIR